MLSDFLSEHRFQHVAPEIAGTAKELFFAPCESDSRSLFSLDERNIAHKVRDLKKPVFVRPHILREIPCVAISRRHGLVDEVCDGGLTTIVVHFYPAGCGSRDIRGIKELGDAGLELFDDLLFGGYEFFVDADASITEWSLSGKSHHRGKIYCRGALPVNGTYNLPKTKYVVCQQYFASWLPWFIENTISNYAILDETTQEEMSVVFGNGGADSVGVMSALGLSPARSTNASGAVATYAMPEINIEAFDPVAGCVEVQVTPAEGGIVSGDLVTSCVTVEGSNNLSDWESVSGMSLDAAVYRSAGSEGRFSCTFDTTSHSFYRVKVTGR